jgi:hypothetical protein
MHFSGLEQFHRWLMCWDCGIGKCQILLLEIQYTCQQTEQTPNFEFSKRKKKSIIRHCPKD